MLFYTGPFKGGIAEDKQVTAEFLIDHFGLSVDMTRNVEFRLADQHISVRNGQERFSVRRTIPTLISGVWKNESYRIRYAENKVDKRNENGGYIAKYTPRRIFFEGKAKLLDPQRELEQIVYIMLHSSHYESPFRRESDDYFFVTHDAEGFAKQQIRSHSAQLELEREIIQAEDGEKMMALARGIMVQANSQKHRIPVNETKTDFEARNALLRLLRKFPAQFESAFRDNTTWIRGVVGRSVDQGIYKFQPSGNGSGKWVSEDGKIIAKVGSSQDRYGALMEWALDNYKSFSQEVTKDPVLSGQDQEREVADAKPFDPDESPAEDLVDFALAKNLLVFNQKENKVYGFLDGQISEKAIMNVPADETDKWQEKLKDGSRVQIGKVRNLIKSHLNQKV